MKSLLLGILIGVSVGTWSYYKLQSRTGYGNMATTMKAAGLIAIVAFIVAFTIGNFVIFR